MTPAAFINPAVIHRTAFLEAEAEGAPFEPFRFREGVAVPGPAVTLPLRYAAAGSLSAVQAGIAALAGSKPERRARMGARLARLLPDSGYGPAPDRLDQWSWQMRVFARGAAGAEATVTIDAEGHPGYLATARLMGEAGLLLAEDGATPDRAGCLTPAAAIGTGRLERFDAAKLRFSVA
jgi:short subunit dehydrogenase-like uncharacterized protein